MLISLPKETTPHNIIRKALTQELHNYNNFKLCSTDGSKSASGVGCAFSIDNQIVKVKLQNVNSIYTAELLAIFKCINKIASTRHFPNYLILSDSLSALTALTDPYSTNPIIQRILVIFNHLRATTEIKFIWIPSHVGITGNEVIHRAAYEAANSQDQPPEIIQTSEDVKSVIKSRITQRWQDRWRSQNGNKLRLADILGESP